MKKPILIINTGGTISSIKTKQGYEPALGYVSKALAQIPALSHPDMPRFDILEYDPLLDSSNMSLDDWNKIASDIARNYDLYEGFIVFHGTDTMAYTASALSFMLENLGKPVILTGSQIPLSEMRNDALENIITSLLLCTREELTEVCIYFNSCLLRGNRSRKINAQEFKAFDSPNFPPLANIGTDIVIHRDLLLKKNKAAFHLQELKPQFIANFRLFPGFAMDVLNYILQQPIKGMILETYGSGNAQNNDPHFLKLLEEASQRGIVIVNCSQCQHGYVEMNQYATGFTLKKAGLISGHDMTPEAAHCKLLYLLTKNPEPEAVKLAMELDLCGELTV